MLLNEWLSRKYLEESPVDGDAAGGGSTTSVETDETVLLGDKGAAAADETVLLGDEGDDKGSEGVAAAASDDGAGAEGSDGPPDTYADFVLPEGMAIDETALTEASPLFKELGLTQEQSQKVIDLYAKQIQASSKMQIDDFNQLMSDWRTQSKNDGEFGGDKFDENVKIGEAAIAKYGTPELKQLLTDHGMGNHPEVIRFMVRVGRTLSEDVPGDTGNASSQATDRVSLLYPKKDE